MLKFVGWNTQRNIKYKAKGNTPLQLYDELVNKDIISTINGNPYDYAIMKKYGKSEEDFLDDDDEYDWELYYKWYSSGKYDLTDDEILELIKECNGNAYYQEITEI